MGNCRCDAYIVLVNVPIADGLDAELVHADADVYAGRVVVGAAGKRSVDAIGMLQAKLALARASCLAANLPSTPQAADRIACLYPRGAPEG